MAFYIPLLLGLASSLPRMSRCVSILTGRHALPDIETKKKTVFGSWGFDLDGMDLSVRPGDNFFEYTNGKYVQSMSIPADRVSWGPFDALAEESEKAVRILLERDAKKGGKTGRFFMSFMDEAHVEKLDLAPLQQILSQLRNMKDKTEFARLLGKANSGFFPSVFGLDVSPDEKSDGHAIYIGQSGLGLPDRDYYSKASFAKAKAAYASYSAKLLSMVGWPAPEQASASSLAFEELIANVSWSKADLRDPTKTYNPMSLEELEATAPGFDWRAYFEESGPFAKDAKIVVGPVSAISEIARITAEASMPVLQAWATFHTVNGACFILPRRFGLEQFGFYGKTLSGQKEQGPRWKRGVGVLNQYMGDAVGGEYVKEHFTASSKQQAEELIQHLKDAFEGRLTRLDWLSNSTKRKALDKLKKLDVQVGYPKNFRDYDDVVVSEDDLFGNVERSIAAEWRFWKNRLGKPVDRDMWFMTPQTVNAYNMPNFNAIVFPAAVLQPPFFDPLADTAVNYGALGYVIGHEMTHGFDDEGRRYDALGHLEEWWTEADGQKFLARSQRYGGQFANLTVGVPAGAHIDPSLTMGENIADLGGLAVALDAYRAAAAAGKVSKEDAASEGLRRFFLGFAQLWREKIQPDSAKTRLVTDPHAPAAARVLVPLRNMDAWYEAFNVTEDAAFFLPKGQRVTVW